MKLDVLYAFDAPMPWDDGPRPYGQRKREQRAYREAIEQIRLVDDMGFKLERYGPDPKVLESVLEG